MLNWIVTSCVLIAAMLLIRVLARGKVSARALYALWLLVALRLLIPGSVGTSAASVETVVQRAPVVQLTERLSGAESIEYKPSGNIEAHYTGESEPAVIAQGASEREFDLMSALLSLKKLVVPLWLIGAAGMALLFVCSALKYSRTVRRCRFS